MISRNIKSSLRLLTVLSHFKPFLRKTHSFHSQPQVISGRRMKVCLVPALEDNYMYLLIDETTKQCAAVDPVEPQKILAAVKEEGATLTSILTTHHHWDHANGNEELANHVKGITVYGGDKRIGALNNHVSQGTEFKVRCLFTPCHTSGHICYYITSDNDTPAVFTGDTLFVGGCGRFFEGTAEQMYTALVDVLAVLPGNTRVYCGHEYTVANLKYALHVEPKNNVVKDKLSWAETQRSQGLPTIPSTIGDELTFNPFMRVREESVQQHTGCHEVMTTMAALREEKNSFRPK